MQSTVLYVSLFFMLLVTYGFVATLRATDKPAEPVAAESGRKKLLWGMVIAGVIITPLSLFNWPHSTSSSNEAITINATGYQWYWEIDTEEVQINTPVIFNVHTKDVTHGLGVMDPNGTLLFQTQAMPGYVNKVEYVFSELGEYRIVCMEFCGVAHHDMITEFEVLAQEGS